MTIQEKIIYFEGEEKRLTEKAQGYARKGRINSAKATMSMATGVKATIDKLKKKV